MSYKYDDKAAFCIRPPARIPVPDMRPTRGYIQHLSRIPDGERWPVLSFRVIGAHDDYRSHGAMLTNEGRWRWFEGYAHLCPDECQFSQGQLGDVLAAAGIAPGLPFQSCDQMNLTKIEYVERVTRPAVAVARREALAVTRMR